MAQRPAEAEVVVAHTLTKRHAGEGPLPYPTRVFHAVLHVGPTRRNVFHHIQRATPDGRALLRYTVCVDAIIRAPGPMEYHMYFPYTSPTMVGLRAPVIYKHERHKKHV